jgi:hypothetical protein
MPPAVSVVFRFWVRHGEFYSYGESDEWEAPANGASAPPAEIVPCDAGQVLVVFHVRGEEVAAGRYGRRGYHIEVGAKRERFAATVVRRTWDCLEVIPLLCEGGLHCDLYLERRPKHLLVTVCRHGEVIGATSVPPRRPWASEPAEGFVPRTLVSALWLAEAFFGKQRLFEAEATRGRARTAVRCFHVLRRGTPCDVLLRSAWELLEAGGAADTTVEHGGVCLLMRRDGSVALSAAAPGPGGGGMILCGASLVVPLGTVVSFVVPLEDRHFRADKHLMAWTFSLAKDVARQVDAGLAPERVYT